MERDEYCNRIKRLKPIIEAQPEILRKAAATIESLVTRQFPSDVTTLGIGTMHGVAAIGTVYDSQLQHEIYLAVKARHTNLYKDSRLGLRFLAEQLGAYETAFERNLNPPYFVGAIRAQTSYGFLWGIIMEDVSHAKQFRLEDIDADSDFCIVLHPKNRTVRRYIDPSFPTEEDFIKGKKYLERDAMLEVLRS